MIEWIISVGEVVCVGRHSSILHLDVLIDRESSEDLDHDRLGEAESPHRRSKATVEIDADIGVHLTFFAG